LLRNPKSTGVAKVEIARRRWGETAAIHVTWQMKAPSFLLRD
jgi:hypothetical protein